MNTIQTSCGTQTPTQWKLFSAKTPKCNVASINTCTIVSNFSYKIKAWN
uniref:Uncharacterized protein n=1 Tax=Arundo donax TaxID=35708 RepID=A0A0A9D2Q1_ARUDO